jgi:hypothetical protein
MSGERVVPYGNLMSIMAEGVNAGLCNTLYPSDVEYDAHPRDSLVVMELEEMGHNKLDFSLPYHHRARFVVSGVLRAYIIDVLDTEWRALPEVNQWIKWVSESRAAVDAAALKGDKPEEDGTAGVREPSEPAAPTDDAGATVPHEVPVG